MMSYKNFTIRYLAFCLILLFPLIAIAETDQKKGYHAFVQEDYQTAITHYKKVVEKNKKDVKSLYFLGVSYLRLKDFEEAKEALVKAYDIDDSLSHVWKGKIYEALNQADEGLKAAEVIEGDSYYYYIVGFIILLLVGVSIVIYIKRKDRRVYKEKHLSQQMTESLEGLNSEFKKAHDYIVTLNNKDLTILIDEVEDRCIMLNDKFENLRFGLIPINEEGFQEEIKLTSDMITECLKRAKKKQKV